MIIVAILAVVQGLLGLLRTADCFEIGSDLSRRGVLLLPISMMVYGRGVLVALIAVLYGVFAWGLLARLDLGYRPHGCSLEPDPLRLGRVGICGQRFR